MPKVHLWTKSATLLCGSPRSYSCPASTHSSIIMTPGNGEPGPSSSVCLGGLIPPPVTSPPQQEGLQRPHRQSSVPTVLTVYRDMAPSYRIPTLGIAELPLGQGEARMVCAQIQASGPTSVPFQFNWESGKPIPPPPPWRCQVRAPFPKGRPASPPSLLQAGVGCRSPQQGSVSVHFVDGNKPPRPGGGPGSPGGIQGSRSLLLATQERELRWRRGPAATSGM